MSKLQELLDSSKENVQVEGEKASIKRANLIESNGSNVFSSVAKCFISGYPVRIVVGDIKVAINNRIGAELVEALLQDAAQPYTVEI